MALTLRSYAHSVAIGVAIDDTDFQSRSITKKFVPINPGGLSLEGTPETESVPTEHATKGTKYRSFTKRNDNEGTLACPLFPSCAGLLLKAAVELSANGVPKVHEIYSRLSNNLGTTVSGNSASDFGSAKVGVLFNSLSMEINRQSPGHLSISLGAMLNADRAVAAASTTSVDVETLGTSKVFTCASATAFAVGEYVTITDGGTSTVSAETHITAISGNNITVANLSINVNGGVTPNTITKVRGTPVFPPTTPGIYNSSGVYIDLDVDSDEWTGDNSDVESISIQYSYPVERKNFRASSDPALNGTWTEAVDGTSTISGTISLLLAQDAYMSLKRAVETRSGRVRIMGVSAASNASTTTTGAETAGSAVVVGVAATTGFSVNDYVLLNDGTNQAVGKITAISVGVSITIDTLDVDIASGATVRNTAFELKIPRFDINSAPMVPSGNSYSVQINFEGQLLEGETELLAVKAYDDDNA